jgi:hypothetical protein
MTTTSDQHNAAAPIDRSLQKTNSGGARDRINHLQVVVDANERAEIKRRAEAAGLSVSAYLRAAALNHRISSVLDHAAVGELVKVAGDQGRLGGLLKLWLVDRPGNGAPEIEVRQLLERLGELQTTLAGIVGRL